MFLTLFGQFLFIIPVQIISRPCPFQLHHLTFRCAFNFFFAEQLDSRLGYRLIFFKQPSRHPAHHTLALLLIVIVRRIVFQQVDTFGKAHARVETLGIAERVPGPLDVKKIFGRGADDNRCWRPHHQVICVVHPKGELAENVLLGILWTSG